jgi:hypothetical protein
LILFFVGLPVYARLLGASDPASLYTDHETHLKFTLRMAERGEFPPHPLYHYCLLLLSFGFNPGAIHGVAAALLALALGGRAYLSTMLSLPETLHR